MKIALDVMGFENEIIEAINAARKFIKKYKDTEIILVGNENKIKPLIKNNEFEIHHANDVIKMSSSPIQALRMTESSMYKSVQLVANNVADGVLSAGSTASFVTIVYYLLKPINNLLKPGFMPFLPTTKKGKYFVIVDVGANKSCNGNDLYNFAKMANIYFQNVENILNPSIGIINIGTEANKGFDYHHEANQMLSNDKKLNYVGFVEPRNLLQGIVDIAISDGYTGNLVLKSLEGGLKALSMSLKTNFKKPWNWLSAISSIFVLKDVSKTFDYKNKAGAIMLGLNKPAVKTHGSADKEQFYSSLALLHDVIAKKVTEKIHDEFINGK